MVSKKLRVVKGYRKAACAYMQAHAMTPLQMMRAVLNALQQPSLFSKGIAMQQRSSEAGGAGGSASQHRRSSGGTMLLSSWMPAGT